MVQRFSLLNIVPHRLRLLNATLEGCFDYAAFGSILAGDEVDPGVDDLSERHQTVSWVVSLEEFGIQRNILVTVSLESDKELLFGDRPVLIRVNHVEEYVKACGHGLCEFGLVSSVVLVERVDELVHLDFTGHAAEDVSVPPFGEVLLHLFSLLGVQVVKVGELVP